MRCEVAEAIALASSESPRELVVSLLEHIEEFPEPQRLTEMAEHIDELAPPSPPQFGNRSMPTSSDPQ